MKLFFRYLKQRRWLYAAGGLFAAIFLASFLLYRLPPGAVLYPFLLCALAAVLLSVLDFLRILKKHRALCLIRSITDAMELPPAEGITEEDYSEIIRLISDEHSKSCAATANEYSDMVNYYTVWAHQIKTPIAAMRLNLQNQDSDLSRKQSADLNRIEQYVEMVLTFLRLNSESSDYVIREYSLDGILRQGIKKFSSEFISRKIRLIYEPTDIKVITDEKWLSFVIEQLLSNALKYTREGSITVSVDSENRLSIRDTGIGIAPEDLPRIFENGYTGFNGRTDKRASGIGLYLCKRICTNLGHGIAARSKPDEGTVITLDLNRPKLKAD